MGKLGKPQKSKKQKKMKPTYDSDFQRDLNMPKRSSLKNLAPEHEDYQEMPRKVKNIMKSQQELKRKKNKKKLKNNLNNEEFRMERGMSKPLKAAPRFVQGKKEKDHDFMRRVNLETKRVLVKAQIEDKYKIDFQEAGSDKPFVKRQKSERKKEQAREHKRKKVEALRQKKLDRKGDFSEFRDEVKFGEVAMQPPELTARPRKASADNFSAKPKKRKLLLNDLMEAGTLSSIKQMGDNSVCKPKTLVKREEGKTVKRKFLSPAQQRITDSQRQRAIDLYRKLKNKKMKPRDLS